MYEEDNIKEAYFDYIYTISGLGVNDKNESLSKREFGNLLNEIQFTFVNPKDDSRAADGTALRYSFAMTMRDAYFSEIDFDEYKECVKKALNGPCSVLEMMVALAQKIENIAADPDYPDRTSMWINKMICSLGITGYQHSYIQKHPEWKETVRGVVEKANNREYEPNGKGGYFHIIPNTEEEKNVDVRELTIWNQAMMYLNTIL